MRALLFVALIGCGSDSKDPQDVTAADLRGRWSRELAPGQTDLMSFRSSGSFHPAITDDSSLFVRYASQADAQVPHQMGTFTVGGGNITFAQVWDEFNLDTIATVDVPIIAFSSDELSIETRLIPQAASQIETYRRIGDCELPQAREGGRTYDSAHATYLRQGTAGEVMSAAFADDGALLVTGNALTYRYDDECVPEVDLGDNGNVLLVETTTGVHRVSATMPNASYTLLAAGELSNTPRMLPVAGTAILGAADADGAVAILAQGNIVIRDTDGSFAMTTITGAGVPLDFQARAIAHAGGGKLAFVGDARIEATGTRAPFLVEEASGGFTSEAIPSPTGTPTEFSLATDGTDRWVIFTNGSVIPRVNQQHLARRLAGTWTTQLLAFSGAMTLRVHDGIGHIASGLPQNGGLLVEPTYTRVDGDTITQFALVRAGTAVGVAASGFPAGLAVQGDTAFVAFNGTIHERAPNAETTLGTAKVTVQISGSGRVRSLDGLVDCTTTCTVTAPVGQRLLLRTEPATATIGGTAVGPDVAITGAADIEVAPLDVTNPQNFMDRTITVQF